MIDPINLAILIPSAIMAGAVVGLLPGLNGVLGLIAILPFMHNFSVHEILLWWVCYLCATQYYGSVSALLLKVPGETSSLPALLQSRDIVTTHAALRCYKTTAYTSFVGAITGLVLFAMLLWLVRDVWYVFFGLKFSVIFLVLVLLLLIFYNGRWLLNLLLISVGTLLANVGEIPLINQVCGQQDWMCFALRPTDLALAMICLYAVPYIFIKSDHFDARSVTGSVPGWGLVHRFRWLAIRHGVLGFVQGFVPGLGVTLSANTSAALEQRQHPRSRMRIMASAEAANNSSIISCTIPFLLLGLPITATELVLDVWFMVHKATVINAEFFYQSVTLGWIETSFAVIIIVCLAVANLMLFILTSRFARLYTLASHIPAQIWGLLVKCMIMAFTVIAIGLGDLDSLATIFTLIFFTSVGVIAHLRKIDVIALPISLMIGSFAVSKFMTAFTIWSP